MSRFSLNSRAQVITDMPARDSSAYKGTWFYFRHHVIPIAIVLVGIYAFVPLALARLENTPSTCQITSVDAKSGVSGKDVPTMVTAKPGSNLVQLKSPKNSWYDSMSQQNIENFKEVAGVDQMQPTIIEPLGWCSVQNAMSHWPSAMIAILCVAFILAFLILSHINKHVKSKRYGSSYDPVHRSWLLGVAVGLAVMWTLAQPVPFLHSIQGGKAMAVRLTGGGSNHISQVIADADTQFNTIPLAAVLLGPDGATPAGRAYTVLLREGAFVTKDQAKQYQAQYAKIQPDGNLLLIGPSWAHSLIDSFIIRTLALFYTLTSAAVTWLAILLPYVLVRLMIKKRPRYLIHYFFWLTASFVAMVGFAGAINLYFWADVSVHQMIDSWHWGTLGELPTLLISIVLVGIMAFLLANTHKLIWSLIHIRSAVRQSLTERQNRRAIESQNSPVQVVSTAITRG